jgi:hypothetical protein
MQRNHDTPALMRALDSISFEADLAMQDIQRRLADLRSGLPLFTPPPVPPYAGPKRPLGNSIDGGTVEG